MNQKANKRKDNEQALKDIKSLDVIYKTLLSSKIENEKTKKIIAEMTNVIKKEIETNIVENRIDANEYINVVKKTHIVEMDKDEAIRYYADKILYDCITDCSENNRIFRVDEYANNDFIIKNFAEIVKRINLDERVSDLEVDSDKKEIDMVFYLEYCPHCFQEDLNISDESRERHLKEFKDYIEERRAYTPERWLRTNTRELINDFYTSKYDSVEDKDFVYNLLSEELYNSGFVDKYLDGYTVNVNAENIDYLINTLDKRINELQLENGEIENG